MNLTKISPVKLTKVIDLEGGIGENVFCVIAEMKEMAQLDHCTYRMTINQQVVTVDEHTPLWVIIKRYEERS